MGTGINIVGIILKLLTSCSALTAISPTILTPLPGLLRVPQSLHGSPPLNSECLTFDLYGNKTSMTSSLFEDFQLVENLAVVKLHNHCELHPDQDEVEILGSNGSNFSTSSKENAANKKRHICVQTELTSEQEFGCDNSTRYRFSVLICDKWWRAEEEDGNPVRPNPLSSTPADSPLIWGGLDHLPIEALCVLLPKKPWCHPRLVCNWFPNMGRCRSKKYANENSMRSSEAVHDGNATSNYFIVGILKDFEHHKTCTTFIKKSEKKLKLYQTYNRVEEQG